MATTDHPLLDSLRRWFFGSTSSGTSKITIYHEPFDDELEDQANQSLLDEKKNDVVQYDGLDLISQIRPGDVHLHGTFSSVTSRISRNGLRVTDAIFTDGSGSVRVVWFKANVAPLIKHSTKYELRGNFRLSRQRFAVQNPKFRELSLGCIPVDKPEITVMPIVSAPIHRNAWTEYIYGKGLNSGSTWQSLRQEVFKRDGYKCVRCGANQNLTVDHVKELSIGGKNELANLRTLCKDCHEEKHLQHFLERGFDADDSYGEDYRLSKKIHAVDSVLKGRGSLPIKYKDKYDVRSYRIIHPKEVYKLGHRIYIRAYCELDKADRTFRVSRLELTSGRRNVYLDKPVYQANAAWADFRTNG